MIEDTNLTLPTLYLGYRFAKITTPFIYKSSIPEAE